MGRSEFDFIDRLRRDLMPQERRVEGLSHGIGDDAAIVEQRAGFDSLITTDLLVEGIDFDFDIFKTSPRDLGHKALAVSLSDIAAMGARPRWALLSVALPQSRWSSSFLEQFYKGVRATADAHGITIIGGDISRTPAHVVVDSIVLGEVARGRAVLRSGARRGDRIYVTGALGGAGAGLRVLQDKLEVQAKTKLGRARRQLVLRQIRPTPRVEWGRFLGENRLATAMIDVSDGLSSDLAHLCRESGVGAIIEASRIPVDVWMSRAGFAEAEALSQALNGGEDFELLFTVRPRDTAKLPAQLGGVPLTYIGEVNGAAGKIKLSEGARTRSLKPGGFEHFKRARR